MSRNGPLRLFIGYDSKEPIAYHVLCHSILRQATIPVSFTPLVRSSLHWYTRQRGPTESTEFSMTRFLVPFLCNYQGWAVFLDCDMLVQTDIVRLELEILRQRDKALLVCQHDYTPTSTTKFLNQPQTAYPRKNWSSVMVFNTERCRKLTPEYVNTASGLDLHRFAWLRDEEIGSLPLEWNWLSGEYPPNPDAYNLHYTLGGPWFPEYSACDQAAAWDAELGEMLAPAVRESV